MFILYNYGSTGYYRLVKLKNIDKFPKFQSKIHQTTSTDNIYKSNISRSKSTVKDIVLSNDFNFFVTLTIKNDYNRYNIDNCFTYLRKFCKKFKRKFKTFDYLFIAEYHKDGAIHFHGVCNIPLNAFELDFYPRTFKSKKDNKFYHCFSSTLFDEFGRNSFQLIKSKACTSSYILKYISKDCVRTSTHRLYMCSHGLERADKTYLDNDKLDKIFTKNRKYFENDFCKMIDFKADDLNSHEKFDIMWSPEVKKRSTDYEFEIFMNKFKNFINNSWYFIFLIVY